MIYLLLFEKYVGGGGGGVLDAFRGRCVADLRSQSQRRAALQGIKKKG